MAQWTQRYLQLQATAGEGTNGTFLSCLAIIDEPGEAGPTAALLGVDNLEIAS